MGGGFNQFSDEIGGEHLQSSAMQQAMQQKTAAQQQTTHINAIPQSERNVAAMLVSRDAFQLANSLQPLTGRVFADLRRYPKLIGALSGEGDPTEVALVVAPTSSEIPLAGAPSAQYNVATSEVPTGFQCVCVNDGFAL